MAANIDDLLNVASAIRSEIKFQSEETRAQLIGAMGGKGGGGGSSSPQSSGAGSAIEKFVSGFAKAGVVLTSFTVLFDKMMTGLGQGISRFVALANPAVVTRFNMAVENAQSALGRVFIPVLERFTAIIQGLGNAIESLSPQAKALIAGLTAGGGLAAVFAAVATAVSLLVRVLGFIPALIIAVVGSFAGIMTTMSSGKEIMAAFNSVLKMVGGIFDELAKVVIPIMATTVKPIMSALTQVFKEFGGVIARLAALTAPGIKAMAEVFAQLVVVVAELFRATIPLIEVAMTPLMAIVSVVARVISAVLVPALQAVAYVIRNVADFIISAVNKLRKLLGMDPVSGFDPNEKHAQAVRQSSITDLRSFANKAYTTAFGGSASDVSGEILSENKQQTKLLDSIDKGINKDKAHAGLSPAASGAVSTYQYGQRVVRNVREFNRDLLGRMRSLFS